MSSDPVSGEWTNMVYVYPVSSAEASSSENDSYNWLLNETWLDYNLTEDDEDANDRYGPPCQLKLTPRHIILIVCFTIIFTLSVIGNCLVIVTIAQNRWMRTVTNIFLQSLAISDLLLSVICMPPTLTAMLFQCFLWGQAMCKLISYLQLSVAASAYTLVAIALERYNAICRPLHSRHWKTKSHAVKMIVAVWVISLLCSSPSLFMYNLVEINPGQFNCRDDSSGGAISGFYILFLFLVLFIVPLVLMIVLYAAVTYTLWMGIKLDSTSNGETTSGSPTEERSSVRSSESSIRHRIATAKPVKALRRFGQSLRDRSGNSPTVILVNRSSRQSSALHDGSQKSTPSLGGSLAPGSQMVESKQSTNLAPDWKLLGGGGNAAGPLLRCTHSAKNLEAKKRVIIMLFVIVAEFLICWSPLYAYLALWQFKYIRNFDAYLYTFLVVLAYLSSCSNPITYCFLNLKFRQAFLLAFGCRFLVKEAPLLYQNTLPAHRRNPNPQPTIYRRPPASAGHGSKYELAVPDQPQNRTIDSLVVQCHEPEKPFAIPLLQLRTPSIRPSSTEASGSKSHNDHMYDSDEDEDELIVATPPKATCVEKGRVSPSPSTPIGNGSTDHSNKMKLNGRRSTPTPSPSPLHEKLTSV